MADKSKLTDGPSLDDDAAWDFGRLPDGNWQFVSEEDVAAFAEALAAPDLEPIADDASAIIGNGEDGKLGLGLSRTNTGQTIRERGGLQREDTGESRVSTTERERNQAAHRRGSQGGLFISSKNDWAPVHEKVRRRREDKLRRDDEGAEGKLERLKRGRTKVMRTKDETREGYLYNLLKWPMLLGVGIWVAGLGFIYVWTRLYIWGYEYFVSTRGRRHQIGKRMKAATHYGDWVDAAKEMDEFLGNNKWKEDPEFAYYDHKTIKRVLESLRKQRRRTEVEEKSGKGGSGNYKNKPVEELRNLVQACVKNNFVGVESSRLYSQTYYGTKNLVQEFIDELERGVDTLVKTDQLTPEEKRATFKTMYTNFGRTALCLSGGAAFAYYHFGVVKALLEANLLPDVITGTSGGALIAALTATRTNEELKQLLVPALAVKIDACSEPISVWFPRFWKTGARFDSVDWARRCSWFTRGSLTFREAYARTGRILNVTCIPSDPHSPALLLNYLTAPDCVIWSAVIASAAVPGILNPVVLMQKTADGSLAPYSFGHKWKDGSLRTDIPLRALNLHFNVNFSIVSQVNPHINTFFFSSRGTPGEPVTHRKGRGWRGGFLGSATEQYIKLDLRKWLKVVRHLELLPRPMGQDWSQVWLQQFSGTITVWPRGRITDFIKILSDPDMKRLAYMFKVGQQSVYPKLVYLGNRMKVERAVERGRIATRTHVRRGSLESIISHDDIQKLLKVDGYSTGVQTTDDEGGDWREGDGHEEDRGEYFKDPSPYEEEEFLNGGGGGLGERLGPESEEGEEEEEEDEGLMMAGRKVDARV